MNVRRMMTAIVGCVALTALTTACGSRAERPSDAGQAVTSLPALSARSGGELAFGIETEPNGFDPTRNAWDSVGLQLAGTVFDPVAAFAADGSVQPYLLERLDHNADYTIWEMHLRAGVTFHDGTPFNADAWMRFGKAKRESLIVSKPGVDLKSEEKIDDLTVRATMRKSWATYPAILTSQGGYPAAAAQLDDPEGQSKPIGTGPFVLQSWDHATKELHFTRNKNYWRKDAKGTQLPYLDAVTFKVIEDGSTRISGLQNGNLDVLQARSIDDTRQLASIKGTTGIEIVHDPGATETAFVAFNTAKAPFDDVRVRKAMAYAIDTKALAKTAGWPEDRLSKTPFAPNSPFFADVDFPGYNPNEARRLLAEYKAQTGRDVAFELTVVLDLGIVQQLVDAWTQVGFVPTVKSVDLHKVVILAVVGQYDAVIMTYFAANDPDLMWHFWHSTTISPINEISINLARFADKEIDAAMDKGRSTQEVAVRKQAYAAVQQRFAEAVPYLWLYRVDWSIAHRPKVHQVRNVTLPDGREALAFNAGLFRLTETWVET